MHYTQKVGKIIEGEFKLGNDFMSLSMGTVRIQEVGLMAWCRIQGSFYRYLRLRWLPNFHSCWYQKLRRMDPQIRILPELDTCHLCTMIIVGRTPIGYRRLCPAIFFVGEWNFRSVGPSNFYKVKDHEIKIAGLQDEFTILLVRETWLFKNRNSLYIDMRKPRL